MSYIRHLDSDLKFLHWGHFPSCSARVNKHYDGYFTIQYIARGEVELFYDSARYLITPGWYWPAFPGPHIRFHSARADRSWDHYYVAFCGLRALQWMADGFMPKVPQAAPPRWNCRKEFEGLLSCLSEGGRWNQIRAGNMLERLLIELASLRDKTREPADWLKNAMTELGDIPRWKHNYAQMAADAGMSESVFRRRFKQETGISLHAYALECRVTAARKMLAETDLPVKSIADTLGYGDVFFFSRQFRKLTGVSPKAYRESCK